MNIPFVDLKRQYLSIKGELDASIAEVLHSTQFILGQNVYAFEQELAQYCGVKHAIGVASGTDALALSLQTLDIGQDDEVITVANTFIATVGAIWRNSATPVLVDIDPNSYNIDPTKIEDKITDKTKAIIPVHLYGQAADMTPIRQIAKRHNLYVVEDVAQACGATYQGERAGSLGDIGCFSFYPTKNLGAYGDGGAIVTDHDDIADKVRLLRHHGQREKNRHELMGHTSRLDEIQASILRVKLKYLEQWNEMRRQKAALYRGLLDRVNEVTTPREMEYGKHVYHLFVIRCPERDRLQDWLSSKGISSGLHYPLPIHLQKAYRGLRSNKDNFPISEKYAGEILSLPMFAELKEDEIEYVCAQIKEFYAG